MNTKIFFSSFLLASLILLSGCKPSPKSYDKKPITFYLSNEFSHKEMMDIIVAGITRQKWTINEIKDSVVYASLFHKGWYAKIAVKLTDNLGVILNETTRDYVKYENGVAVESKTIKALPYNWLYNIRKRIKQIEATKMKK